MSGMQKEKFNRLMEIIKEVAEEDCALNDTRPAPKYGERKLPYGAPSN